MRHPRCYQQSTRHRAQAYHVRHRLVLTFMTALVIISGVGNLCVVQALSFRDNTSDSEKQYNDRKNLPGNPFRRPSSQIVKKENYGLSSKLKSLSAPDNVRSVANTMLWTNSAMLLHGDLAFPTLVSSMISSKLVAETNQTMNKSDPDGASWKAFISLFFSGVASLNGWLLRSIAMKKNMHHQVKGKDYPGNPNENKFEEGTMSLLEQSTMIENETLRSILLFGSRGMELTGGIMLLFLHLMALKW